MPEPTPPLDLDAIQRALEHLMWLANTERGKSPEAVLTAFSLARQAGLLVERVRALEAEVAELRAYTARPQGIPSPVLVFPDEDLARRPWPLC